jgi:hypothetical protein
VRINKTYNLLLNNQTLKFFFYFLLLYAVYCAITVGESWDEADHVIRGKTTFQYLLSFARIRKDYFYSEFYSSSYWFFQFFFSQLFPLKYQTEVNHIINLAISISSVIGFSKLISELFNKFLGKIIFFILIIHPIFFGHMSINPKDTVVAFCNVWIFYLIIKYLKNQSNIKKSNRYVFTIGVLFAIGSGVQLLFVGSLIPIFFFLFLEILFFKKITIKNFNYKTCFIHFLKFLLTFYFFLIFFLASNSSKYFIFTI